MARRGLVRYGPLWSGEVRFGKVRWGLALRYEFNKVRSGAVR